MFKFLRIKNPSLTQIGASHIVERSLKIDVNILIHFLERLASEIILNNCPEVVSQQHILNGVNLPRSWILSILARNQTKPGHRLPGRHIQLLLSRTGKLLLDLYEWGGVQGEFFILYFQPRHLLDHRR